MKISMKYHGSGILRRLREIALNPIVFIAELLLFVYLFMVDEFFMQVAINFGYIALILLIPFGLFFLYLHLRYGERDLFGFLSKGILVVISIFMNFVYFSYLALYYSLALINVAILEAASITFSDWHDALFYFFLYVIFYLLFWMAYFRFAGIEIKIEHG
jgi:hypothetical protein